MKRFAGYFLLLLFGTIVGIVLTKFHGYVLVVVGSAIIETTLWFTLVLLFLFFSCGYFFLRTGYKLWSIPKILRRLRRNANVRKLHRLFKKGIVALIVGDYSGAEKFLLRSIKKQNTAQNLHESNGRKKYAEIAADFSFTQYLLLAYTAHEQGDAKKRDDFFGQIANINNIDEKALFASSILQTTLLTKSGSVLKARSLLEALHARAPKNVAVQKLLAQTYQKTQNWHDLLILLPKLYKYTRTEHRYETTLSRLTHEIYAYIIGRMQTNTAHALDGVDIDAGFDFKELRNLWRKLPDFLRSDPEILAAHIRALRILGYAKLAEKLLLTHLPETWHEKLLREYESLPAKKPWRKLQRLENYERTLSDEAATTKRENKHHLALLLCLGRMSHAQMLWGKAQYYFEQSLKCAATSEAYYNLGQIMDEQNNTQKARDYYEASAKLAMRK